MNNIENTILMTKDEANAFLQSIGSALKKSFNINKSVKKILEEDFSAVWLEVIIKSAAQKKIDLDKKDQLAALLNALYDSITKIPVIKLILGFDPSQAFIKKLSAAINQGNPTYHLLEFEKDTSIMGGVVIEIEGRRIDRSLIKKLRED